MLNHRFVAPLLMAECLDTGGGWASVCGLMETPKFTQGNRSSG